jgi:FkbM family methyltransferase
MRFSSSALAATYWANPEDRKEDEDAIAMVLRPGDTYVDVGANIGALALCASDVVGEQGKVYAIEAHPRTFGFLAENVSLNRRSNVRCFNVAVGEHGGTVFMSDLDSDDQNHVLQEGGVPVKLMPLDDLLQDGAPVSLLKIDVEGYELQVLRGAGRLLQRSHAILFEIWDNHTRKYGYEVPALLELLNEAGFEVFSLNAGRQTLVRLPPHYRATRCENVLALRSPSEFCSARNLAIG